MIKERRMFGYLLRVVRSSLDELEVARRANLTRMEMRPLTDRLLGDVADLRSALHARRCAPSGPQSISRHCRRNNWKPGRMRSGLPNKGL